MLGIRWWAKRPADPLIIPALCITLADVSPNVRNYLYISDAKVDSYLPQIDNGVKKTIAARLGFDVKILQASVQTEWTSLDNRVRRLEAVEQEILRTKAVGALDGSDPWIEASSDVTAAVFRANRGLTFFFCRTKDAFVGLVVHPSSSLDRVGSLLLVSKSLPTSSARMEADDGCEGRRQGRGVRRGSTGA